MTRPTTAKKSPLVVFVICFLGLLADGYDLYSYGATVPGFLKDPQWGIDKATVGTVGSIALVGMLIGSLIAGLLSDRYGRRKLFLASIVVFSVFMVACSLAPSFAVFAVFRFLACLGLGGLLPTAVAIANEFASVTKKSIALGAIMCGPATGTVIASLVAANTLPTMGVRPVYAIGAVALLLVPVAWKLLPESPAYLRAAGRDEEAARISAEYGLETPVAPRRVGSATKRAASGLFRDGLGFGTVSIWIITGMALLLMFGLTTWLPQVMAQQGYGTRAAVTFLLWYSLGAIVGTLIASQIAQRTTPKLMVTVGFALAVLALVIIRSQPSGTVLIIAVVLAGMGGMGTQNVIADHTAQFYPASLRATGLGWALAVGRLGAIAGPTYGAMIPDGNLQAFALAFGVPAVIGLVVAAIMPSHISRQRAMHADQEMASPEQPERAGQSA